MNILAVCVDKNAVEGPTRFGIHDATSHATLRSLGWLGGQRFHRRARRADRRRPGRGPRNRGVQCARLGFCPNYRLRLACNGPEKNQRPSQNTYALTPLGLSMQRAQQAGIFDGQTVFPIFWPRTLAKHFQIGKNFFGIFWAFEQPNAVSFIREKGPLRTRYHLRRMVGLCGTGFAL